MARSKAASNCSEAAVFNAARFPLGHKLALPFNNRTATVDAALSLNAAMLGGGHSLY